MAQTSEHPVLQAERALARAHLSLDLALIDSLLHDDYVIVQPGGVIETKQDVLASYRSGQRRWDHAEVNQLDLQVYGQMARVIGLWQASGSNQGVLFDYQARFISIWVHTDCGWRNLSYASAEIASS